MESKSSRVGNWENQEPVFRKYGKITALARSEDIASYSDIDFYVFEKIDGGNCQVRKDKKGNLLPGSRANVLKGKILEKTEWFRKFKDWTYQNYSLLNLPSKVIMFGEWSGNHSIEYNPEDTDVFYLIDLFDLDQQRFFDYGRGVRFLEERGVEGFRRSKVLDKGRLTLREINEKLLEKSSLYEGPKEGLVLKSYGPDYQLFLKIYTPQFTEKRALRDGSVDLLTPARFRKNLYQVIEEQGKPSLTLEELAKAVVDDVESEEGLSLDLRKIKNKIERSYNNGGLNSVRKYIKKPKKTKR